MWREGGRRLGWEGGRRAAGQHGSGRAWSLDGRLLLSVKRPAAVSVPVAPL